VLLSAARRGLWQAARRFDPSRGVPFPAFAKRRIGGAIVDELRFERFVVRRHRQESGHLRAALGACSYDARFDELTDDEVSWLATWGTLAGVRAAPVRGDVRLSGAFDEDLRPADVELDDRRLLVDVQKAIATLDPVQRIIVEGVAFEGKTIEEAALPRSKSWGSRLFAQAITALKRAMVRAGYTEYFAPGALPVRGASTKPASGESEPADAAGDELLEEVATA
jgi:RNA polymerase sigma factor for flagellar operon FliA